MSTTIAPDSCGAIAIPTPARFGSSSASRTGSCARRTQTRFLSRSADMPERTMTPREKRHARFSNAFSQRGV
eukprot:3935355-Rhodomonas_salina.1